MQIYLKIEVSFKKSYKKIKTISLYLELLKFCVYGKIYI